MAISHDDNNRKAGLALACPTTSRIKGYPFEVILPENGPLTGAVLADQVRNLDWKSRRAEFIAKAPANVLSETLAKLNVLITD